MTLENTAEINAGVAPVSISENNSATAADASQTDTDEPNYTRYHRRSGRVRGPAPPAASRDESPCPGKPDADFNFAHADPAGRHMMPVQYLHPLDGHSPDENGMVDLSPLCGTLVRIVMKGVRLIWSCDMPVINTLVEIGALAIAPGFEDERYKYLLVDPVWTRRDVFERWHDEAFEPGTLEASDQYLRMRTACRIKGSEMPSVKQLDATFRIQRETGHFGWTSLLAHVPLTPETKPAVLAYMRERLKSVRDHVNRLPPGEGLSQEELCLLEPLLVGLRESCLAVGKIRRHYRQPSEKVRKGLWQLGVTRTVGCINAYAVLGTAARDESLQLYTRCLLRFEQLACEIVPDFDIRNPEMVRRALEDIAFSPRLTGRIGRVKRYNLVRYMRILLSRTRRFCLSPLSPPELQAVAPATHPDDSEFATRLLKHYEGIRVQDRINRKDRSDEVARRYERVVDGAAFRAQQIARDGEAGRAALDHMLEPKNQSNRYRQYEVEHDELDAEGLPTGHKLALTWRCWRTPSAWDSLRIPGASVRDVGLSVHYRRENVAKRVSERVEPFVFELTGVERDDGGTPLLPWYVILTDNQVLTSPGHLTLEQRKRWHELRRVMQLPEYTGSPPGFLSFERDRSTLARIANALDKPRRFIPLAELDISMMMAAHGLDSVVQTWCRPHEFQQQTAYFEDWQRPEEDKNDLDPESDWGFNSIRKVASNGRLTGKPSFIECSESLFVSGMKIVATVRRLFFANGEIPISPAAAHTWKIPPRPWVYSTAQGAVRPAALDYFLRVLLAGIADATYQDFRHASSHRANKSGEILTLIKAGLGQRSERLARYYSRLCLEDRRPRRTANANRKRQENAKMRSLALQSEHRAA